MVLKRGIFIRFQATILSVINPIWEYLVGSQTFGTSSKLSLYAYLTCLSLSSIKLRWVTITTAQKR